MRRRVLTKLLIDYKVWSGHFENRGEKMAIKTFCFVESMAMKVIKMTEPKHSRELLEMLPEDLCHTMITEGNINQIMARINRFRYEKEDMLAKIRGLGYDWEDKPDKRKKLQEILNDSFDELTPNQEALKRQIKFLSLLSLSIQGLRFIRKRT